MIEKMLEERGGNLGVMDDRYCIDNGAMIAYNGLLQKEQNMPFEDSYFTQRFRTDEVLVTWRD